MARHACYGKLPRLSPVFSTPIASSPVCSSASFTGTRVAPLLTAMATLAQAVLRRGLAFGGSPPGLPVKACAACFSRGMSTSETARITGSVLGNHSVKVRGDKVGKAMEEVERREKLSRLNEMMERRAFHEKGFEKTRRHKKFKKWNAEYKAATAQHNWMTLLKSKGVPIPGQKRRTS